MMVPAQGPVSPTQVIQIIWGFMASQALHVAAKLAVFDVLGGGPKSPSELAISTGADEHALRRLLRFLTAVNMLTEDEQGRFSATPLGEFLRSDHPQSVRSLAVMYGESFCWRAWGDFYETIRHGTPGFERVHGATFFDHLARHPADAAVFQAGMTSASNIDLPAILEAYDFSAFRKIVDIGGGHGTLLHAILKTTPYSTGVLCDLPSVVAGASVLRQSEVASRCEILGIDMFESVPAGGDAYILKRIVHDWSDVEAVRILQNCRRAITPQGKLLVMEAVVQPSNQPDPAKWLDLNMLALFTGRERTADEFDKLFAMAGFRLTRVLPALRLSIIEGVPA